MKLGQWIASAQGRLQANGLEAAKLEAELLAAHVLLVDRTWIIAHPDADFPELAGESLVQRRLTHEPLAYILGRREFYGREFAVRSGVLVPRQETETLVEAALGEECQGCKVLDIGTGSGCIAITLALERPTWHVYASDVSEEALDIARANGDRLGANVEWIVADVASGIAEMDFDLIVSNPPYVAQAADLPLEIRSFEPEVALYAGQSGLDFYHRISIETPILLSPRGAILLELGVGQLEPVRTIFENRGWCFVQSWKDLLGVERVIKLKRKDA
jgi:release factor glutamine methyltransferase